MTNSSFSEIAFNWGTADAFADIIKDTRYRDCIVRFLSEKEGRSLRSADTAELDLIDQGVLVIRGFNVEFASPLVRAIFMRHIVPLAPRVPEVLPITYDLFDVRKFLRYLTSASFSLFYHSNWV